MVVNGLDNLSKDISTNEHIKSFTKSIIPVITSLNSLAKITKSILQDLKYQSERSNEFFMINSQKFYPVDCIKNTLNIF